MQQGQKCGVQGAEAGDLTVDDHFVYLTARLGAIPWAGILWFLEEVWCEK